MAIHEWPYKVVGYIETELKNGDGKVITEAIPIVGVSWELQTSLIWLPRERGDSKQFRAFNGGEPKVGKAGLEEVHITLVDGVGIVK